MGEGYSKNEIERDLSIRIKSVEKYRADILEKLNQLNASALAVNAAEKGRVIR